MANHGCQAFTVTGSGLTSVKVCDGVPESDYTAQDWLAQCIKNLPNPLTSQAVRGCFGKSQAQINVKVWPVCDVLAAKAFCITESGTVEKGSP